MHDHVWPLVAIRDDGATIVAYDAADAAAFRRLRPADRHVHRYQVYAGLRGGEALYLDRVDRSEWIVRDDAGRVVSWDDLPRAENPRPGWYRRRLDEVRHAVERGLPIPRCGRRGRYGHGWRWFAHAIAGRAADAALADDLADWGHPGLRVGRTRTHLLPEVGDDVAWRSNRRCWKDYRRHQWR